MRTHQLGAGSAGCIVASRLAETGSAKVLLLEAGGTDQTRLCTIPGMVSIIHTVPQVKKRFDWGGRPGLGHEAEEPHAGG